MCLTLLVVVEKWNNVKPKHENLTIWVFFIKYGAVFLIILLLLNSFWLFTNQND